MLKIMLQEQYVQDQVC